MTNLSKELCEICGIKRKRKIFDQRCDNTCKYLDKTDVYNPCKRGNNLCPTYIKYVYPDFEQAENFVKLQKLLIEMGMGLDIQLFDYPTKLQIRFCWDDENFTFKIYGDSLEEVFLRFAIQICELDDEGDIKQAIKETEWVYE